MKVLCLLNDVLFMPKIESLLKGHDVKFLDSYNEEEFNFMILDMDHKDSYILCKRFPDKSMCFGSHMDIEAMKRFRDTGCKKVFSRSAFFEKIRVTVDGWKPTQ